MTDRLRPTKVSLDFLTKSLEAAKNLLVLSVCLYIFLHARSAMKATLDAIARGDRNVNSIKAGKDSIEIVLGDATNKIESELTGVSKQTGGSDAPASDRAVVLARSLNTIDKVRMDISAASDSTAKINTPSKATALPPTSTSRESWVYLGRQNKNGWNPNFFGLQQIPNPGATISSSAHWVNQRSAFPVKNPLPDDANNYDLTPVIGVLMPKQTAVVREVRSIQSDEGGLDWWARIQ